MMKREDMRPELQRILDQAENNDGEIEANVWIELSDIVKSADLNDLDDRLGNIISYGQFPISVKDSRIIDHDTNRVKFSVSAYIEQEYWEREESLEEEE